MIKKQGMLSVIKRLKGSKFKCLCDCGNERTVAVGHFNAGYFKSCGCHVVRHGHGASGARSRTYVSYYNMLARCHNPKNKRYKDYGDKGVLVCESWKNSFVDFLKDMGECPDDMLIERIDNSKGYEPSNCKWATRKENQINRNNSKYWLVEGYVFERLQDAANKFNVSDSTIRAWCAGRTSDGRTYKPKDNCYFLYKYPQT